MSLLPRNLTLFRVPSALNLALDTLDLQLPNAALKPLGAMELHTSGFVSPFGHGEADLTVRVGQCIGFTLGTESKILPSSVVAKELQARLDALAERAGRRPGGRERKRLKDEVLTDLLPRALARPGRINGWVDIATGWLVIDTASRTAAEAVVSNLREALGGFPVLPVNAESSVRVLLTGWVGGEPLPDGFLPGDECELRDPVDAGAVMRCRNQDLDSDEIRENLKAGKQCFRLGMTFDDRLGFVLSEDLVIRKLRFLEAATEALERDARDNMRAEIDATFALVTEEVARLLTRLEAELQWSGRDA